MATAAEIALYSPQGDETIQDNTWTGETSVVQW